MYIEEGENLLNANNVIAFVNNKQIGQVSFFNIHFDSFWVILFNN